MLKVTHFKRMYSWYSNGQLPSECRDVKRNLVVLGSSAVTPRSDFKVSSKLGGKLSSIFLLGELKTYVANFLSPRAELSAGGILEMFQLKPSHKWI